MQRQLSSTDRRRPLRSRGFDQSCGTIVADEGALVGDETERGTETDCGIFVGHAGNYTVAAEAAVLPRSETVGIKVSRRMMDHVRCTSRHTFRIDIF